MTFKQAVEETPSLADACQPGLQALRRSDRQHVEAEDTRRLRGSVDVDTTLATLCPNEPRWDYGIAHAPTDLEGEIVYWVEIHPGTVGEVNVVLEKLAWLKQWLRQSAPQLHGLPGQFIWVSSGATALTRAASRRMASRGLQHKGRQFKIPNKAVA